MSEYPEIVSLQNLIKDHSIQISMDSDTNLSSRTNYPQVTFQLQEHSFTFYVDDEYDDFLISNPPLDLCVVLRELEDYAYAEDYLVWCTSKSLQASNSQVRDQHMKLRSIYAEVEAIVGEINSHVSDYDFELNAGAAQALREKRTEPIN